ncbi:IclR family transcriptional regulator [Pseudonocardia sp. HH130630-07]|uniref:IclR family transcriptional regulator n=1 Tax=Pseudonocardia sp. HH130630-07 TaxID=1690815 RepID=UPI000814EC0B|nr:helix-turn-helix domain-containing protein [Pseudonocardia sp. HH130630-07]ANY07833.1 hypothetical protein AFB00_17735 [Pseudonocardia sp. HH130630-07]
MNDDRGARSAATKVLDVLTALAHAPGPHRIVDLAAATGLAKATVHRMLRNLVESGFVVTAPGGCYTIGPRFLGIAAAALAEDPRRPVIRQGLERLRAASGLSAHFVQRFADQVVTVDSLESTDPYGLPARPGHTAPVGDTAFGSAVLATGPGDPPPVTVRDDTDGVRSIAAPVLDGTGGVIGAIGVSGTAFTLADAAVERLGPLVAETAATTSSVLRARSTAGPQRRHA